MVHRGAPHFTGDPLERVAQPANYNDRMLVFRYAALAALVVWLGATAAALGHELIGPVFQRVHMVGLLCGAVAIVSLFVVKFVGPPPRAFTVRAAIVFLMCAVALYAVRVDPASTLLMAINGGLGLVLLYWYSKE
jgi:hypothetical protein